MDNWNSANFDKLRRKQNGAHILRRQYFSLGCNVKFHTSVELNLNFARLVLVNIVDCLQHVKGEMGALELSEGVVARPHHWEELTSLQKLQHHQAVLVLLVVVVDVHHPLALREALQEIGLFVHQFAHLFVGQFLILGGEFLSCCLVPNLVNLPKSPTAKPAGEENNAAGIECYQHWQLKAGFLGLKCSKVDCTSPGWHQTHRRPGGRELVVCCGSFWRKKTRVKFMLCFHAHCPTRRESWCVLRIMTVDIRGYAQLSQKEILIQSTNKKFFPGWPTRQRNMISCSLW